MVFVDFSEYGSGRHLYIFIPYIVSTYTPYVHIAMLKYQMLKCMVIPQSTGPFFSCSSPSTRRPIKVVGVVVSFWMHPCYPWDIYDLALQVNWMNLNHLYIYTRRFMIEDLLWGMFHCSRWFHKRRLRCIVWSIKLHIIFDSLVFSFP